MFLNLLLPSTCEQININEEWTEFESSSILKKNLDVIWIIINEEKNASKCMGNNFLKKLFWKICVFNILPLILAR